ISDFETAELSTLSTKSASGKTQKPKAKSQNVQFER
ncbi:hypothetical protein VCHE09_3618, partial [Vibrio paracholerae HE-09]